MMRMGMGTPSNHNRIQPTFPACSFKRAVTMKSPANLYSVAEAEQLACPSGLIGLSGADTYF